jgi:hypothetical protein
MASSPDQDPESPLGGDGLLTIRCIGPRMLDEFGVVVVC